MLEENYRLNLKDFDGFADLLNNFYFHFLNRSKLYFYKKADLVFFSHS